jgi:hypothetical protein
VGLKITRLYNSFEENNQKIINDINKVCHKRRKKSARKEGEGKSERRIKKGEIILEKNEVITQKFFVGKELGPEMDSYQFIRENDAKADLQVSTAVNSKIDLLYENPIEPIPNKPINLGEALEEKHQFDSCKDSDVNNEDENKDEFEVPRIYTILINYDCGFGNALYITGESDDLGNWCRALKLSVASDCGKLWAFKSLGQKEGVEFKTLIYKWVDEDHIELGSVDPRRIFWERPSGAIGNRVTKFENLDMIHLPKFRFK